jgi:hypothetical protein
MDSADNQIAQIAEDDAQVSEGIPAAVRVAAGRAKAEARKVSDDRRLIAASPVERSTGSASRASSRSEVSIVDLSRRCAAESDQPLKPGSRQALEIAGAEVHRGAIRRSAQPNLGTGATWRHLLPRARSADRWSCRSWRPPRS